MDNAALWDSRQLGASMEHAEVSPETLPYVPQCIDVMLDLETMGLPPDGPVISIGAACFDINTGFVGDTFYQVIDLASEVDAGARITPSTVTWWLGQSDEAREAIIRKDVAIPAVKALKAFTEFLERNIPDISRRQVWGNGAAFDNVMLRTAYERQGMKTPWYFNNDQDVRTLVRLGRVVGFDPKKDLPFEGVQHNALADALHQVKYVSAIYQKLGLSRQRGLTNSAITVDTPAFS